MASPPRGYIYHGNGPNMSPTSDLAGQAARMGYVFDYGEAGTDPEPTLQFLLDGGYSFYGVDAKAWSANMYLSVAYQAYNAGLNVITMGNDTTSGGAGNPIWTGSAYAGNGKMSPVVPAVETGHPVAQGWPQFNEGDAGTYLTGVRASAVVVGNFTVLGALQPAIIAEENPNGNGARYIHCEPIPSGTQLWTSMLNWLATPGGMPKVFDGNDWVYRPVNVWNGTKWVKRPIKAWDGTTWKNI